MGRTIPSEAFSAAEIILMMRAGFLTSSSRLSNSAFISTTPNLASSGTITSIFSISRSASGSMAAVGGEDAINDAGGRGGIRRSSSLVEEHHEKGSEKLSTRGEELNLSLPSIGPYLKLLTSARSHMISLLGKSRFREMPMYLLRERWYVFDFRSFSVDLVVVGQTFFRSKKS